MNGDYIARAELARMNNGTETYSEQLAKDLINKLAERKHWGRHSATNPMLVILPAVLAPHCPEKGGRIYQVQGNDAIIIVPVETLIDRLTNAANGAFDTRGKFIPCVYSPRQGVRLSFARPLFNAGMRLKDSEVETLKAAIPQVRRLPKGKGFSTSEGTAYFLQELMK